VSWVNRLGTLDGVREILREHDLRVTASRIEVLRLLAASERPVAHQDVVDALSELPWNRSTLYRNLMDLTERGLARRTVIGGLARFELNGRANSCAEHPHFVCTSCGDVKHLEGATVRVDGRELPATIAGGDFEVQLRGRCDGCGERAAT